VLLREDDRGVLAIGQASHAWISGQLARAWGNSRFGALEPAEEVILAANQHDVGMALWDLEPTLNPATGLPHSFLEMPLGTHLGLWSAAPRRLLTQSRYAALLVSMHGRRLYELRDLEQLPAQDADAIRAYFDRERRFEDELLSSLRADPVAAAAATPELIRRNGQLIWTWDFLSLALCLDWAPATAHAVPAVEGPVDVQLTRSARNRFLRLDPWPLRRKSVTVRCDARRLTGRFDSDESLKAAIADPVWETVEFSLRA
jgi:Protein of unknown function (DUF3891)